MKRALARDLARVLKRSTSGATTTSSSWAGTRCWRSRLRRAMKRSSGGVALPTVRPAGAAGLATELGRSAHGASADRARVRSGGCRRPLRSSDYSFCRSSTGWARATTFRGRLRLVGASIEARRPSPRPDRGAAQALRTCSWRLDGEPASADPPGDCGFALRSANSRRSREPGGPPRRSRKRNGGEVRFEDGPLIRGRLVGLGETEHVFLMTLHHIVSDGWSMGVCGRA